MGPVSRGTRGGFCVRGAVSLCVKATRVNEVHTEVFVVDTNDILFLFFRAVTEIGITDTGRIVLVFLGYYSIGRYDAIKTMLGR